jgi:hypothetical protein
MCVCRSGRFVFAGFISRVLDVPDLGFRTQAQGQAQRLGERGHDAIKSPGMTVVGMGGAQ